MRASCSMRWSRPSMNGGPPIAAGSYITARRRKALSRSLPRRTRRQESLRPDSSHTAPHVCHWQPCRLAQTTPPSPCAANGPIFCGHWHTNRGGREPLFGWRTRFWSFLLKFKKDQPSWTIQAQPGPATGPFHWWCNRHLTAHELCRLQTFPRWARVRVRPQFGAKACRQRRKRRDQCEDVAPLPLCTEQIA